MKNKENWKTCEEKVAKLSGGQLTPRSGGGYVKGDISVPGVLRIEVKSTEKEDLNAKVEWFNKLEEIYKSDSVDVALAVFFNERGYIYYRSPEAGKINSKSYIKAFGKKKTVNLEEKSLPTHIVTHESYWLLDDIDSLKEYTK